MIEQLVVGAFEFVSPHEVQAVLEAKASGYERLLTICGDQKNLAPTLLMVEKMPELIREQVKAIQNLKIDKITVWDSGGHNGAADGSSTGTTANFMRGLIGSLPPMHELAKQVGVELPGYLGSIDENGAVKMPSTNGGDGASSAASSAGSRTKGGTTGGKTGGTRGKSS